MVGCARATLYLLGPFSSASILGCADCTIVVPAVSGVVFLAGCERVSITVACAKLVIRNCLDCDLRVASLSASVIYGDCRGVTFGKPRPLSFIFPLNRLIVSSAQPLLTAHTDTCAPTSSWLACRLSTRCPTTAGRQYVMWVPVWKHRPPLARPQATLWMWVVKVRGLCSPGLQNPRRRCWPPRSSHLYPSPSAASTSPQR